MYEGYIKSASAIVKVITEKDIFHQIINNHFLDAYIPSVTVLKKDNIIDDVDAIITIEKTRENKIDINYPQIYYGCEQINLKDIITLIEFVLERSRQEKGIICIHGAGAIINNKLIVCWGTATGMGKTSLALKLAENGNLFYSDEKILIDLKNKKAVGRIKKQYVSNNYWKNKYGENEYYVPTALSSDNLYEVGLFVQPIICDQDNYILDKWDEKKFLWHLYEEASRKIRGTSRVFFNNTYPAMPLDTQELALKRLNLIKEFTKTIPSIYFKGNEEVAINLIKKLI